MSAVPTISATPAETSATAPPARFVPKIVRQITMPQFKLREGDILYALITTAMGVSKPLKGDKGKMLGDDGKPKEPPTMVQCVKLDTGELGQFIAGSVIRDIFDEEFPKNSYVGRSFMIEVGKQKEAKAGGGRRYNNYTVNEIETPEALREVAVKAAAAAGAPPPPQASAAPAAKSK